MPIHDEVINRVEELADEEKQPQLINKTPLFEWNPGHEIRDIDETVNDDVEELGANIDFENENDERAIDDIEDDEVNVDNAVITEKESNDEELNNDDSDISKDEDSLDEVDNEYDQFTKGIDQQLAAAVKELSK